MKKINYFFITAFLLLAQNYLKADDTIVKVNGDRIAAKITEVGTNAITYKKSNLVDGPTFVDYKTEIFYVRYNNGEKQFFAKEQVSSTQKSMIDTNLVNKNEVQNTEAASTSGMNKIEVMDGAYRINGEGASQKEVNRLLEKSKNPVITVSLKAAKTTKIFQKIVKITSIPTTIGGSSALLWTGIGMYNDIRRGRDNTSTYVGPLTSLFTTISLPITGKILKNKSDKMYEKLIDMYNVTN